MAQVSQRAVRCTKARQAKRKAGLDLLVIDYLQLMAGEGNTAMPISRASRAA